MKLTRKELVHAQDPQLAALGVKRANYSGWLKKALAAEFTEGQIQAFKAARRKTKGDELFPGREHFMSGPYLLSRKATTEKINIDPQINFGRPKLKASNVGTHVIADRFLAGESIADLSEDYGVPMSEIEAALRFEWKPSAREPEESCDDRLERRVEELAAERFANEAYENAGRDLSK